MHRIALCLLGCSLAFGALAQTQSQVEPTQSPSPPPGARPDTPAPASQQFKAMDRNNDGLVSGSEFDDVARSMFDAMDADQDDRVTVQEMEAARQRVAGRALSAAAVAARKIRAIDVNADGVLSRTEHRDAATGMFQEADQDDDGNLTTQEFDAAYGDILGSLAA
jgi:Ca2+-binding EF-hand superfamily protein